jgi:transforming growth factor-beta-induced protein
VNHIQTTRVRRMRWHRLLAAAAVAGLALAACGDDGDDRSAATDPPAAGPVATGAPTTEVPTTAAPATAPPTTEAMETEAMETEVMETGMEPSGPGCAAVPADGEGSFGGMADDPAATAASNNPVLSTLVGAVTEAGLVDTLNSEGPFTIFAPTNDAFAAVPADQLEAVLADTDLLTTVLTYHVIAGAQLSSADLVESGTGVTVQGDELSFADDNGALTVNGVPAVCIDVPTANATVHIISGVLLPPM